MTFEELRACSPARPDSGCLPILALLRSNHCPPFFRVALTETAGRFGRVWRNKAPSGSFHPIQPGRLPGSPTRAGSAPSASWRILPRLEFLSLTDSSVGLASANPNQSLVCAVAGVHWRRAFDICLCRSGLSQTETGANTAGTPRPGKCRFRQH